MTTAAFTPREHEILDEHLRDWFPGYDEGQTPDRDEVIELLAERIHETGDEPALQAEFVAIRNKYLGHAAAEAAEPVIGYLRSQLLPSGDAAVLQEADRAFVADRIAIAEDLAGQALFVARRDATLAERQRILHALGLDANDPGLGDMIDASVVLAAIDGSLPVEDFLR